MRLKEFIDKNGNQVNLKSTGNASKSTSSGDYKKRLEKLIDYHIAHRDKDVVSYKKDINPYSFQYTEEHSGGIGGYTKELAAGFNIAGDWNFVVFMDSKKIARKSGNGWDKFVYDISFYLNLPPITTDPEYQDLLTEWVDSKGNKVSLSSQKTPNKIPSSPSGYKERFKKLLDYATKHKGPEVVHINNTTISEDGFFYSVMKKEGISVRDFDINVYIRKSSEAWRLRIFWDNSLDSEITGTGYTNLLKELRKYITVPVAGTPEYKDLIFEDSRSTFSEDFQVYENLWD